MEKQLKWDLMQIRVKADFDSEQTSVDEISQAIENLGYGVLKARAR